MRSREFITEAEVAPYQFEEYQARHAYALLKKHCSESLAMIRNPIWRGTTNHQEKLLVIDPSTGKRKSQNTKNFYTELMDNSPFMNGWPKRSQSLVCTTGRSRADTFSTHDGCYSYAIFPFDGAKIAVVPARDLWLATIRVPELGFKGYIDQLNRVLEHNLGFTNDSFSGMIARTKDPLFPSELKLYTDPAYVGKLTPENFIYTLQTALSPGQVGFSLESISSLAAAKLDSQEVWTDSKVVALRSDQYDYLVNMI